MRSQIIKFYNDSDFQKLNSYYNRTTIFNIMNIERRELSHSAFLKWLLDINGSHNFGKEPLIKLLRMLVNTDYNNILKEDILNILLIGDYQIQDFHIETEKAIENDKNKGRIDIFAKFNIFKKDFKKDVIVIIENKVDSKHHDNQTKTYKDWAEKEYKDSIIIPIYLTPYPENEKDEIVNYFIITYQDILEHVIEPLLNMEFDTDTKIVLEDYIINLGQAKKQIDDNGKISNLETILAVSNKNKKTFSELLMRYENLLNSSMVAYYNKKGELKNILGDKLNNIRKNIKDNNYESLLSSFWDTNKMLLRIIYLYGKEYQYLFYEYDAENRIKYTDDTEKFPERAYIEWDFYKGDLAEKYHLVLNGVKVMTLKFWSNRKVGNEVIDDFKTLSDYAEKHYGIKTEKA